MAITKEPPSETKIPYTDITYTHTHTDTHTYVMHHMALYGNNYTHTVTIKKLWLSHLINAMDLKVIQPVVL
jgi:hypothetical protein